MMKMTKMISFAVFWMVLLCSTDGENQWKRRIARAEPMFRERSNVASSVRSARATPVFTPFQTQALIHKNSRRSIHCVSPLVLNASLNAVAQAYAQKLASSKQLVHSSNGYGENLWAQYTSGIITATSINGSMPVEAWYSEVRQYNYAVPTFGLATGHFTQLVWKGSQQLGMGIACTRDQKSCYVVANYWPPGNYLGQFANNVKPATCSG